MPKRSGNIGFTLYTEFKMKCIAIKYLICTHKYENCTCDVDEWNKNNFKCMDLDMLCNVDECLSLEDCKTTVE